VQEATPKAEEQSITDDSTTHPFAEEQQVLFSEVWDKNKSSTVLNHLLLVIMILWSVMKCAVKKWSGHIIRFQTLMIPLVCHCLSMKCM
jgi:MFS superfamily sulfate permease-like transporter